MIVEDIVSFIKTNTSLDYVSIDILYDDRDINLCVRQMSVPSILQVYISRSVLGSFQFELVAKGKDNKEINELLNELNELFTFSEELVISEGISLVYTKPNRSINAVGVEEDGTVIYSLNVEVEYLERKI